MIRKAALGWMAAIVLVLGACGSDGDGETTQAADSRTADQSADCAPVEDGTTTSSAGPTGNDSGVDADGDGVDDDSDGRDDENADDDGGAAGDDDNDDGRDDENADDDGDDDDGDDGDDGDDRGSAPGVEACATTSTAAPDGTGDRGDAGEGDDDRAQGAITADGDYTCDGDDMSVVGSGLHVGLSGTCGTVAVDGSDNQVDIAEAQAVTINGAGHEVEVGFANSISLSGANHNLDYGGDPEIDDDSVDSDIG